jgi:carboxymethylenebutenolidase
MTDDTTASELSRRRFGATTIAAGLAASGVAQAADLAVTETDVMVTTPDGISDAVLIHPSAGKHPGVLIWTDIMGLRPAFRQMGARIAGQGYTVLVPNPFYRSGPAPNPPAGSQFSDPAARAVMMQLMGQLNTGDNPMKDAVAYVSFLDAQAATDTAKKIGVTGYCMGGPLSMRTAAAAPERVGAGASFHGGSLVTDKPDSPHLLIPKMKASFYFGISGDDDAKEPHVKDVLRDAFKAAGLKAEFKVYAEARHGWCVPGGAVYKEDDAEIAMAKLLELFKSNIA